ncbi:thiol peroxidase [Lujinxingia vulgaris]|uniref:Thiol peroxidase n=2 Tax=Lujinxingia vulgaris TaxID=2600176 RepID=A0A5C6X448_9DELT|nr:thiol peroxidase [Lujinxingia vulgaris]
MECQMTKITFKGNPVTLSGTPPSVGESAPEFHVHKNPGEAIALSNAAGKRVLLTTAPSVDTGICAAQLRTFEARLAEAGDDADFELWFVTRDLPFALDRFAEQAGISHVKTLSDYKDRTLGEAFGLVIDELGLLARTVFVIDKDGTVLYRELVPEIATEPDYDDAWAIVTGD